MRGRGWGAGPAVAAVALLAVVAVVGGPLAVGAAADSVGPTVRVTYDIFGGEPNESSFSPATSQTARYVAFTSRASDLVETDLNGVADVFVADRIAGTIERVSVDAAGADANAHSERPSISDDGRTVAFVSLATDIVDGPVDSYHNVYVRDMVSGTTALGSVLPNGLPADAWSDTPALSGDGDWLAFTGRGRVYLRHLVAGTTVEVAPGNEPSISDDGGVVAFTSNVALVAEDTDGAKNDTYVWYRSTGTFELASPNVGPDPRNDGVFAPVLSGDGTGVTFESKSDDLVAYPSDAHSDSHNTDIFFRDLVAGTTEQVSVTAEGLDSVVVPGGASLPDVPTVVAYATFDRNVVPDDGDNNTDVFLRSLVTHDTVRVSVDTNGDDANGASGGPSINGAGTQVAFVSAASDLVAGDVANPYADVYVTPFSLDPPPPPRLSVGGATITEGDAGKARVAVPVTLSEPVATAVTASWSTVPGTATAPGDFVPASGTVTIPAGSLSATVPVTTRPDRALEGDESLLVALSDVQGAVAGTVEGTVAILDDDLPVLSVADVTTDEGTSGQPHVAVPVRLSEPAPTTVTAQFRLDDGTATAGLDYLDRAGTVTIPAGRVNAFIDVTLVGDGADGGDETFTVVLESPAGAVLDHAAATVTLRDDDPSAGAAPAIGIGDVAMPEGDDGAPGVARFPVVLSAPAATDVTVSYATSPGTADGPGDFTPASGSITVPAGDVAGAVHVNVTADTVHEADETFTVQLTGSSAGSIVDGAGTGTIVDDEADEPLLNAGRLDIVEGDAGQRQGRLSVTLSAPADVPVEVPWSTVDGQAVPGVDFVARSGSVTIPAGSRVATIPVVVIGDTFDRRDDTFAVQLGPVTGAEVGDGTGEVTIVDDDAV